MANDLVPLEELAWFLDEPLADLSSLGFYALSGLAAQHVTVALSGQGADELFGGYTAHRNAALIGAVQQVPGAARVAALAGSLGPRRLRRPGRILGQRDPVERFLLQQSLASDSTRARLLAGSAPTTVGRTARETLRRHVGPE